MLYVVDIENRMYLLLNTVNMETKMVSEKSLFDLLNKGTNIENVKIANNTIKGTRGDLKRYNGIPVVLYKLEDDLKNSRGYKVFIEGKVKDLSVQETINLGLQCGLANAKVVTNTSKSYISCIGGSFPIKTVRNERVEYSRIIVELIRKPSKTEGLITLTDIEGKMSRKKFTVKDATPGTYFDGVILGKVFNNFLKYKLYDIIEGRYNPKGKYSQKGKKPAGVVIAKTAYFKEGLSHSEYHEIADYLGITLEKLLERQNSCVYQIKI
ncbi:hypothetical protein [Sinanaerobacter sp. ZZT-01]|uniref:hypothetical protein n=1 Tax=Sinanaerobacter sp. ZZT-01 TaxID=3111540 RepID=UPI002D77051C|nr:hypothetical protein [Sinanaerobacter sp. ZZT-01]WRR92716.1 hypothetical protein U5921_11765 [Sinanaerobacter sp. ZZT-01]